MNRGPDRLRVAFGALAPSLRKQLEGQGFKVRVRECRRLEKAAEDVIVLRFQGFLTEKEQRQIEKRIFKSIPEVLK